MKFTYIDVTTQGPVTTVVLNRPEVMNAINPQMHDELQHRLISLQGKMTNSCVS